MEILPHFCAHVRQIETEMECKWMAIGANPCHLCIGRKLLRLPRPQNSESVRNRGIPAPHTIIYYTHHPSLAGLCSYHQHSFGAVSFFQGIFEEGF